MSRKVESLLQDVTIPTAQTGIVQNPLPAVDDKFLIKRSNQDDGKITRANIAQKMAEAYERDHEMIEGEFLVHETGKNSLDFRFKKWQQDDYEQYELHHRHRYILPRMVIRHINHGIHYKQYKELPGQNSGIRGANASRDGKTVSKENMKLEYKVPRFEFRVANADPMDHDLNQPQIVDANTVNMFY